MDETVETAKKNDDQDEPQFGELLGGRNKRKSLPPVEANQAN